jgi:hypothetical protein
LGLVAAPACILYTAYSIGQNILMNQILFAAGEWSTATAALYFSINRVGSGFDFLEKRNFRSLPRPAADLSLPKIYRYQTTKKKKRAPDTRID